MLKSCSEGPSVAVRHLPRCRELQNLGLTVWGSVDWPSACLGPGLPHASRHCWVRHMENWQSCPS